MPFRACSGAIAGGAAARRPGRLVASIDIYGSTIRRCAPDARRIASEAPRPAGPDPAVTIADLVFQNELNDKRRSGPQPVVPIHAEPVNRRCRDAADRRRLSTGVMFLDAPDELIIVNRDQPTRRFLEARYAMNCVFVPYAGITSFALARPPAGRATRFHELRLRLDRQVIRQACLVEPERVIARLAARGASQTPA